MADSDFKSQVLAATDIVQLISQSVALKRRGKNYIGLCPFHNEKTPSFNVDPVRGYFKCFGCKAYGNAIDFVMKRDRLDFVEAMKQLGEQAGIEMPKYGATKEKTSERQALLDIHARAAEHFHRNLLHPATGRPAREYLVQRGFTEETIQRFKVGYAPPGWDGLLRSKELASVRPELMALGGLAKARESGGHYDTFRNRLMFPIRDENGRTIAFGGRVMPGSDDPAKYLNSPETPIFSKSRAVFGLDLGRDLIVESRTVAITEGYTDTAMAHQFGATNVVSILGTAMTDQHLGILSRFADRIVLLFDADAAGATAVNRSLELFLSSGKVDFAVATIPEDLDPDEYLLKYGLETFNGLIKNAEDALTFKWRLLEREFNAAEGSLTGQQRAIEAYLTLLANARASGPVDAIRWGAILRRVERLTGIPVDQLNGRFAAPRPSAPHRPAPQATAPENATLQFASRAPEENDARAMAEKWILGVLLAEPSRWVHVQAVTSPGMFAGPARRRLAEFFWERVRNEGEAPFNEILGELPGDDLRELAVELLDVVEKTPDLTSTLDQALKFLDEQKRRDEENRRKAGLDRPEEDDRQVDELRALQAQMKQADLRRLGPRKH